MDRATSKDLVRVRLNVQGEEQGPDKRHSLNLYGVLPGQSGKYILHLAHVDGFLYAQHCNGGGLALTMALAKHLAKIPANKRKHGHIFLMVGDHENPGVGATDKFIEKNRELMENDVLMVLRPEKTGMVLAEEAQLQLLLVIYHWHTEQMVVDLVGSRQVHVIYSV